MIYAIGDIHGESQMVRELLASLPLEDGDELVFVGDYVDRGPDSKGVIDTLIELAKHRRCSFLLGNHEAMFLDFLGWSGPGYFGGDAFLMNGGDRTLASYGYFDDGVSDPEKFRLPAAHEAFFRGTQLSHLCGDYLFVHAGIGRDLVVESDPEYAMEIARPEDLLWDRSSMAMAHKLGVTIVYGHTPDPGFQVRWNSPFSIGIDTGAVYGGLLTALRLPDETLFQV